MTFQEKLRETKKILNLRVKELATRWEVTPESIENWLYRGREPRDFNTRLNIEKDMQKILKNFKADSERDE